MSEEAEVKDVEKVDPKDDEQYKLYLVLKERYEREWSVKRLVKTILRGIFYRRKNNGSPPEFSAHKFLGFILFWLCVGIWMFGGNWLTEEQTMKLLESGHALPSKWGVVPVYMIGLLAALLGLDGLTKVFKR